MALLLEGEASHDDVSERFGSRSRFVVSTGPTFPGVARDDGAGIGVFSDDIFARVVDIFGLDSGADFDEGGMATLLGARPSQGKATKRFGSRKRPSPYERFDVCSGPVFPGVACDDGAGIDVFIDGKASISGIAFSAALRSAFCRKILSTNW